MFRTNKIFGQDGAGRYKKWLVLAGILLCLCVVPAACSRENGREDTADMDKGTEDAGQDESNKGSDGSDKESDGSDKGQDGSNPDQDAADADQDSGSDVSEDTGNAGEGSDARPEEDPPVTDEHEKFNRILAGMTLEEKVGQMFFSRCPEGDAAAVAAQYKLGGYILFARDFRDKTREEVISAVESYQKASAIPMLIGVDEEGGTVVRASKYPAFRDRPFMSPQGLFEEGGWDLVEGDTVEKTELLQSLGINVNLAPVCDVSTDKNDFINARAFGQDAEMTSQYVSLVVDKMKEKQMGSVLKHFPGYGNNVDTHTGIALDERSMESFRDKDFLPFSAGIKAGADAVLVSHNIVSCMDQENPASLSEEVHKVLREELGFDGVIMTDDLYMDAVALYTGTSEAAVLAVLAGNDMLCCTDFEVQVPAVIEAVKDGTIPEKMVDEAVLRILAWKSGIGLDF